MPKGIITAMEKGYQGKGLSKQEVDHRVYGKLNNEGAMRGSKETPKGAAMEKKFQKDHSKKK